MTGKGHIMIEVGKVFPGNLHMADGAEGCKLHITADPPIQILAIFPNPSPAEIFASQGGTIRVGLLDAGDHTLFLLMSLGGAHWADMPYSVGLIPPHERPKLRAMPDRGYAVSMALIDGRKIVRTLRLFTLTPRFSMVLDRLIQNQLDKLDDFTPERHNQEIDVAYRRWPTAAAMAKDALLSETAGQKFSRRS